MQTGSSREALVGKTVLVHALDGCVMSLPEFANPLYLHGPLSLTDRYRIPADFPISYALSETWIRVPEYDTLREEAPWEPASFQPKAVVWK